MSCPICLGSGSLTQQMRNWRKDRHKDTCTEKLELDDLWLFQSGGVPTKQATYNLSTFTIYSPAGRAWLVSVRGLPRVAISGCVHQRGAVADTFTYRPVLVVWQFPEPDLRKAWSIPCNDTHCWRAFCCCCCCSVELSLLPTWKEMTNYILILLLTAYVNDYITSQCLSFSINQI